MVFDVGDHVIKTGKGQSRSINCKYCDKKLPDSKDRWKSHLNANCKAIPDYVKSSIPRKRKASESVTILSHSESGVLEPSGSASNGQRSILKWIDKTNQALLDELNDDFSSMIYSTGIPFVFADHPKVRQFLKKLKPSWNPPSAKVIAGTLLKKKSNSLKNSVNDFISQSEYVSLVSDGWSNLRREHMVNYVIVTPNHKPVLLGTEDTTGVTQDATEIANALGRRIEQVGVQKVAGVVTDNAANMVAIS
jgi:Protein of unknown function (DUF 659)